MQTQGENLILKEIYWACFLSSCIYTYQIALPWLLAANTIPSCNIIIVMEIQVWYKRKLVYLSTDMIAFWFLICVFTLLVNTASKYVNSSANQHDAHPTPLKLRSFKNHELDLSDLPQNSNFGWEFVQKSGVQIPVRKVNFFCPFFFSFSY